MIRRLGSGFEVLLHVFGRTERGSGVVECKRRTYRVTEKLYLEHINEAL